MQTPDRSGSDHDHIVALADPGECLSIEDTRERLDHRCLCERDAVPAKSMLSVLSLGAKFGTEVILEAEGEGAEAALDTLADLLARNLDEEPAEPAASSG